MNKKSSKDIIKLPSEMTVDELDYQYAHLNLDFSKINIAAIRDPLSAYYNAEHFTEILRVIRDPRNFDFTCQKILNIKPGVFQLVWLQELWKRPFPMLLANRGASKTFTLALYYMLRGLITQGCKMVVTSASWRQAKYLFEYLESIWGDAPILRDLCSGDKQGPFRGTDVWTFTLGSSMLRCIPLGNGEKIRGMRANYLDIEEFSSVPEEIFEVVLRGFTVTSSNPIENIEREAKIANLRKKGLWNQQTEEKLLGTHRPNQIVISGTPSWDFNHFARYFKRYRAIIRSKGDPNKLRDAIGGDPKEGFNWRDYSIIRIPVGLLPKGMMDAKAVANAQATMDESKYNMEYEGVFSKDSKGFFPRLLIESCVTKEPINVAGELIQFSHRISGDFNGKYCMGVDPASESDNFAIVIIECHKNHNRLVYCWTCNRKKAFQKFSNKLSAENSFYSFIARKIRSLMKAFPIQYISIDSQGGGIAVSESLHDLRNLEPGENPLWPLRQDNPLTWPASKDYGYDFESGPHIIEMVSMSNAQYVVEANHGLKKDLENKMLLFPQIDAVSFMLSELKDEEEGRLDDSIQDCIMEVEECKEELATINHTTTQNSRDRWDTPETILPGNKKGHLRKDRYSALLMCNMMARRLLSQTTITYADKPSGGFITDFRGQSIDGRLYNGPSWFTDNTSSRIGSIGTNRENINFRDQFLNQRSLI